MYAALLLQGHNIARDREMSSQFQSLHVGSVSKSLSRDTCREPKIVFYPRAGARLPSWGYSFDNQRRQAFRGRIHPGGETAWTCSHDCDVIDAIRFKLLGDAQLVCEFRNRRTFQHSTIVEDHRRCFLTPPKRIGDSARKAISDQESVEKQGIGVVWLTEQNNSALQVCD